MNKSREILKQYWGFDLFRPFQENIVDDVIYGHDTLALLPTGGGKSICFQVPGIAREGITLVISPLISLMQDQVKNLQKRGIRAKEITSGMSYRDIDITLDNAKFGGIDFLYTSPERLKSKLFIERFKQMPVGLIVVDEAHCISEWGHDFRPSYKDIKSLRDHHPEVPIIALTATATERVKEDIILQLELKKVKVHIAPFERKNLIYQINKVPNKASRILEYCKNEGNKTGIIYCQTRKSVKEIAKLLHANHIKIGIYHGGMTSEERKVMLEEWLNNKINIMVATNAFGMGIDKPDVRFVLHYEFPNNIEAFFQESGRAGRDGKTAKCIVFWEDKDINILKEKNNEQFPPIDTIKMTYRALCNFLKIAIGSGDKETYNFDFQELTNKFQLNIKNTYHSLKILELNNDLVFNENIYQPTRLRIVVGNTELYSFQIKNNLFTPLISVLTRNYPGIFSQFFELNEKDLATKLKVNESQVLNQLKELEKFGLIDINWKSSLPSVTLLHQRLPDDYINLSKEIYLNRKELAFNRLLKVIDFLEKENTCRQKFLLNYFNQVSDNCGICDVCQKDETNDDLSDNVLLLLKQELTLIQIFSNFNESEIKIKEILQELIISEKVYENNGYYKSVI
ncbi:RecQ family ATP-dependent DNA helicase [Crocinitomicaceae bacterium]|nr:RecQ family ATP-dependent DNA helicase [Crocinitomicaceae bacterium]